MSRLHGWYANASRVAQWKTPPLRTGALPKTLWARTSMDRTGSREDQDGGSTPPVPTQGSKSAYAL